MRVLITSVPHFAHLSIMVPYAQALQNAGHEVVFATPAGGEEHVVAAGLAAVPYGEMVALSPQNWMERGIVPDPEKRDAFADAFGLEGMERDHWDVYYQYYAFNVRFFLQPDPVDNTDGLIRFAKSWKPDLVLWDCWYPLGGVAARAAGAPHARVLIGPDYGGFARTLFNDNPEVVGTVGEDPLLEAIRPVAEKYGVEVDDELLLGQASVNPLPEEIRLSTDTRSIPVRWIPFNGGAEKPEWLYGDSERPRVALTLGLSIRLWQRGGDPRLPKIVEALGNMDVDVIATADEEQLAKAARIPDNFRMVEYVPLSQLLPACSMVVHHGSSGTFLTSVVCNLPQVILDTDEQTRMKFEGEGENIVVTNSDRDADSWITSNYVDQRKAGKRMNHQEASTEEIQRQLEDVLTQATYREGAQALHDEWLSRPSPAEIIPELEALARRTP